MSSRPPAKVPTEDYDPEEVLRAYGAEAGRPDRPAGWRVETLSRLLEEYHRKLLNILGQADAAGESPREPRPTLFGSTKTATGSPSARESRRLRRLVRALEPAATDLARHTSAVIENTKLDRLESVELRLRLAEFESALEAVVEATAQTGK